MFLKANTTYTIQQTKRINESKGSVCAGGRVKTLTDPLMKAGEERILVQYSGLGTPGEAASGTKFWFKVQDMARLVSDD